MELKQGMNLHGFSVISCEKIAELCGHAYVLRHKASRARMLYIANSDVEKTFAIAFKTPPADNTGVFHIIEHSVLCGSRKFNVKEPFVDLLKSSMQTFLNAMTYPDKTVYPVSSTNEKDFLNLIDVYLDAVLYPNFYHKPSIFQQEGWHIENRADRGFAPQLVYNGVVYNEMLGALSDPEEKLNDAIAAELFPQSPYAFDAGGTPACIPTLSYEDFLDTHARHYRLDNAYIVLYGDLDFDRVSEFLDARYLSQRAAWERKHPVDAPNALNLQTPLRSFGKKLPCAIDKSAACAGFAFVAGISDDLPRMLATSILCGVLMASNESPLKRALLDADIADEIKVSFCDCLLQPFVLFTLRGLHKASYERFMPVFEQTLQKLASGALEHSLVKAHVAHTEFILREGSYASSSGLEVTLRAFTSWLYDDSAATKYLRFEDTLADIKDAIDEGLFEGLINSLFLENEHACGLQLEAVDPSKLIESESDRSLLSFAQAAQASDLAALDDAVAALRAAQNALDDPKDIACVPRLALSEVLKAPRFLSYALDKTGPLTCLRHEAGSEGIVYTCRCYDAFNIEAQNLGILSLLGLLLGNLDTRAHTALELDTLTRTHIGVLSFYPMLYPSVSKPGDYAFKFLVTLNALETHLAPALALTREIMLSTVFSDYDKIKTILIQRLNAMEQDFSTDARDVAILRAASYFSESARVQDELSGLGFYRFLKDLLVHFDERASWLEAQLNKLRKILFTDDSCLLSFSGTDRALQTFYEQGGLLAFGRRAQPPAKRKLIMPDCGIHNEAFIVPCDVCYPVLSYDITKLNAQYTPAFLLASRALTYDYLWNELRVKGGAYGAYFTVSRTGHLCFSSFRDPHLDESLKSFEHSCEWLSAFKPSCAELDSFKVSVLAALDAPQKPRQLVRSQLSDYLQGFTPEMRRMQRLGVIETKLAEINDLSAILGAAVSQNNTCVFGAQKIIEASSRSWSCVHLLDER